MSWVAAAVVGSAALGYAGAREQAKAAEAAGDYQAAAAMEQARRQQEMFNLLNQQQGPYRQAGYGAVSRLSELLGLPSMGTPEDIRRNEYELNKLDLARRRVDRYSVMEKLNPTQKKKYKAAQLLLAEDEQKRSQAAEAQKAAAAAMPTSAALQQPAQPGQLGPGSLTRMFTAQDLTSQLAPGYEFMKQQGLGAVTQGANVAGGGSNVQRSAIKFAEDYARNAYQDALNNFRLQQGDIYNRLAGISQTGQTAQQQAGSLGQAFGGNIAQLGIGAAGAQAAGQIGAANAMAQGLGSIGGAMQTYGLLKGIGGLGGGMGGGGAGNVSAADYLGKYYVA